MGATLLVTSGARQQLRVGEGCIQRSMRDVRTHWQDDSCVRSERRLASDLIRWCADMPGCLSYIVAKDPADENTLWITEVWDNQASHQGSLSLPAVQQAIAQAKPLIAGFGEHIVTEPVGGYGLADTNGS